MEETYKGISVCHAAKFYDESKSKKQRFTHPFGTLLKNISPRVLGEFFETFFPEAGGFVLQGTSVFYVGTNPAKHDVLELEGTWPPRVCAARTAPARPTLPTPAPPPPAEVDEQVFRFLQWAAEEHGLEVAAASFKVEFYKQVAKSAEIKRATSPKAVKAATKVTAKVKRAKKTLGALMKVRRPQRPHTAPPAAAHRPSPAPPRARAGAPGVLGALLGGHAQRAGGPAAPHAAPAAAAPRAPATRAGRGRRRAGGAGAPAARGAAAGPPVARGHRVRRRAGQSRLGLPRLGVQGRAGGPSRLSGVPDRHHRRRLRPPCTSSSTR